MSRAIRISGSKIQGCIKVPSSKSLCHREIIAAALSEGTSVISNVTYSQDIEATCNALRAFGVKIEKDDDKLRITGNEEIFEVLEGEENQEIVIDAFESGSTLRFLIPLAALTERNVLFKGRGRLVDRPLGPYIDIFEEQNMDYQSSGKGLPLKIEGKLKPGEFSLKGDVSSQFITGLLFALPLLEESSKILITTELESKPYVDLTIDALKKFSIDIVNKNYREFKIKGTQHYKKVNLAVEGDFSQAAFFLAAGVLSKETSGGVTVKGLNMESLQGDKVIVKLIKEMGGKILEEEDSITAYPSKLHGIVMDALECPDLVPIMAVLGALSEGDTEIINAGRLRIKESDRLKAMTTELNRIGAKVSEKAEGLYIQGVDKLKGGECSSWGDHRIAMSMAIASIRCDEAVTITNSSVINKSYPDFYKDISALGSKLDYMDIE